MGLFNDWSARDIQAWEYQPLGPFLSKNFASTVSPWIVTMEALAPFRSAFKRPEGDPQPLPYLESDGNRERGQLDITVEVMLQTAKMREAGTAPHRLTLSRIAEAAYWTAAQQLAHLTVNGASLRTGDLYASGTISGPGPGQRGSLLELSWDGTEPLVLPDGSTRAFLEDGDEVVITAVAPGPAGTTVGLGEVRGTVTPARG